MRIQFQILMFFIFLNIAIFFIAATGFFPYSIGGDAFTYDVEDVEYDINDPDKLPTPEDTFTHLYWNTATRSVAKIPFTNIDFTYSLLMASIVIISIVIGKITSTSTGVSLLIVGLMFTLIWANSHNIIDELTSGLDTSINYLILMFLIGMMISFVILIYDTASGQKSTK